MYVIIFYNISIHINVTYCLYVSYICLEVLFTLCNVYKYYDFIQYM